MNKESAVWNHCCPSSEELWEESGRWMPRQGLMRMNDRHDREFALGPTHEK